MKKLLLVLLVCLPTLAQADWWLRTANVERQFEVVIESFIARSDCIKRGEANARLAKMFGGTAVFGCTKG